MNLLRCPACDGVLKPNAEEEGFRCSSCGRPFTQEHLESLERQRERTIDPTQQQPPVVIEAPDIARRVAVAVLPKPEPVLPWGIKLFLAVWGGIIIVAAIFGSMQFEREWSWDYFFESLGTGIWRGFPLSLSIVWSASWIRNEGPREPTAGEAIEELRQHNRRVLGSDEDENSPDSAPEPTGNPLESTDAITRPTSDNQP
jgi:hypothetical protein